MSDMDEKKSKDKVESSAGEKLTSNTNDNVVVEKVSSSEQKNDSGVTLISSCTVEKPTMGGKPKNESPSTTNEIIDEYTIVCPSCLDLKCPLEKCSTKMGKSSVDLDFLIEIPLTLTEAKDHVLKYNTQTFSYLQDKLDSWLQEVRLLRIDEFGIVIADETRTFSQEAVKRMKANINFIPKISFKYGKVPKIDTLFPHQSASLKEKGMATYIKNIYDLVAMFIKKQKRDIPLGLDIFFDCIERIESKNQIFGYRLWLLPHETLGYVIFGIKRVFVDKEIFSDESDNEESVKEVVHEIEIDEQKDDENSSKDDSFWDEENIDMIVHNPSADESDEDSFFEIPSIKKDTPDPRKNPSLVVKKTSPQKSDIFMDTESKKSQPVSLLKLKESLKEEKNDFLDNFLKDLKIKKKKKSSSSNGPGNVNLNEDSKRKVLFQIVGYYRFFFKKMYNFIFYF